MKDELLMIDGTSSAGYAVPRGDDGLIDEVLHAWTFMWVMKLVTVAGRLAGAAEEASRRRLEAMIETITALDPDLARRRLMRFRILTLIHRLERGTLGGSWSAASQAALDEMEPLLERAAPERRRLFPEILDVEDYPEFNAFRNEDERASRLPRADIEAELSHAYERVGQLWPVALTELRRYVQAVLPMSMPEGHFNSGSSDEVPFVVQATISRGAWPMLLAESLIHEMSHIKLDIASSMQPLLTSDRTKKIYSHPWRQEKRPLMGVLLGAHSFLNVMILYRRAVLKGVDPDRSLGEFELRRSEVGQSLAVLEQNRSEFTQFGLDIFDEMRREYDSASVLEAVEHELQ